MTTQQIKRAIYNEMVEGKNLLEARIKVQNDLMEKLSEASDELHKELIK